MPYTLVLWLSIIVLVPFDLTTIDSGANNQVILVKRIINSGKQWIGSAGKLRDAASVMLSKLITRPDVVKAGECDILLKEMAAQYAAECNDTTRLTECSGILQTLVEIFKTGHRNDLMPRV